MTELNRPYEQALAKKIDTDIIQLTEAQVKQACEHYLTTAQNQGKLWYTRLNAGDFIETRGGSRRRIKGAGAGTADFVVIQKGQVHLEYLGKKHGPEVPISFVIFVECKSTKGKQSPEQVEFEALVKKINCQYVIVRGVEELQEVLERQ